jgi:hypothetical protein
MQMHSEKQEGRPTAPLGMHAVRGIVLSVRATALVIARSGRTGSQCDSGRRRPVSVRPVANCPMPWPMATPDIRQLLGIASAMPYRDANGLLLSVIDGSADVAVGLSGRGEEVMSKRNLWGRSIDNSTVVRAVTAALVLATVLFIIGLAIGYLGDEYAHPAWSERSVPPPIRY